MIDLNHSRNLAVRPRANSFPDVFLLPVLMAGVGMMLAGEVTAQTFKTLYSFTAIPPYPGPYPNSDGGFPKCLIVSGNTLYGTTELGGSGGNGTVFKVNTDGAGFTNLHSLNDSDGGVPKCLIVSGNTLYGTASYGGTSGMGTVFALNTDGTGFATLHSFSAISGNGLGDGINSDGVYPSGLVVLSNTLYGTTLWGGAGAAGTVFKVNTDGTGFTTLHNFKPLGPPYYTNIEGGNPGGLILSSNTLYGTAHWGGSSGNGTVFSVNTDGTCFTNLHSFAAGRVNSSGNIINSDGGFPACLILSGNTLYGTTESGGSGANGTVFAVNTDATGFTTLHSFTAFGLSYYTNSDGGTPSELILSGNTLYGTATRGGSDAGTVFAVNTDGTGFTTVHGFTALELDGTTNSDGANPDAGLILSGTTLYGTAAGGGSFASGTVFSLTLPPPQLTIIPSRDNVILTWPTNATGYTLQSTTNLVSRAWTTNSPAPVIVNGQNTVTNPIIGTQRSYRLSQ